MKAIRFLVVAACVLAAQSDPVSGQQQHSKGVPPEVPNTLTAPTADETVELPQSGRSRPAGVPVRDVYADVGRSAGITVVFDPQLGNTRIDVDIDGLPPDAAFDIIARSAGHFITPIDDTTLIVAEDTPQKRREFEGLAIRLFVLENAPVKEVEIALRSLIEARRLVTIDSLNSVLMRDTEDKLAIAERIIDRIDRPLGEVEVSARILRLEADAMAHALTELGLGPLTGVPLRLSADQAVRFEQLGGASLLAESTVGLVGHQTSSVRIERPGRVSAELELDARVHPEHREVTLNADVEVATPVDLDDEGRTGRTRLAVRSAARVNADTTILVTGVLAGNDDRTSSSETIVVALTPTLIRAPEVDPDDLAPILVGTEAHITLKAPPG